MGDIVASHAIEYLNKNDEINQFIMSRNLINNEIYSEMMAVLELNL